MSLISSLPEIMTALWQHLEITFLSVGVAILVGVPLGIFISTREKMAKVILGVAGVFQTIPSLALFGLIIPFLGIGIVPSIVVLFLYALLPIITNTYIGITSIDVNLLEAARGMGMSKREMLFKVELPLSIPMIMGGIKISSVTCAGTATIAALIGAGGLGSFIFRGISTGNNTLVMMGAIPAAMLAVLINNMFGLLERALKPLQSSTNIDWVHRFKKPIVALGLAMFFMPLLASSVGHYNKWKVKDETVIIGHKSYTEQRILGQMYSLLIENHTDLKTRVLEFGGTQVVFNALASNEIDMYPEYTGTAYTSILNETEKHSPSETYDIVKSTLKAKYGMEILTPLGFNNTYVFLAKPEFMEKYNISKISDLKSFQDKFTIGIDMDFVDRPDGLVGLREEYGFKFNEVKGMGDGLLLTALKNDKVDVSVGFGTDGRIKKYGFEIIEDDKQYFPEYNVAPLLIEGFEEKFPECYAVIDSLSTMISDSEMQELNLMVSDDNVSPRDAATQYLEKSGLI